MVRNVKMTSDGVAEQPEKNERQPGKTTTHSDTDNKLTETKEVSKVLPLEQSLNTKKTPAPQQTPQELRKGFAAKLSSFGPSPFSIEKMRCTKLPL